LSLRFLLLGVVLLAAVPLLYLGVTQFIEYDGYCYIFGAGQDRWRNLILWYKQDPHPPLFYFLLRGAMQFGRSHLAYRAVSILSGLGTIYLIGLAASKMMRSSLSPVLAALAFGLALPTIIVSTEVRAYMLCTLFLMLSYCAFLDLLAREGAAGSLRTRIVFAAAAALACLSDYYAFFYVAAVLSVTALSYVLLSSGTRRNSAARDAATFAPVLGLMTWQYFSHARAHAVLQGHLLSFYYRGGENETLGAYFLRNLQNVFNLFSPWPVSDLLVFLAVLAGLLVAAGAVLWLLRPIAEPRNRAAWATVVATGLMLVQLMAGGALGKYPFGGFLRQQFLLFPFLVLCAFLLPDRLARGIPRPARFALAALLFLAILGVSYRRFDAYPKVKGPLFTEQMERYNRLFPSAAAVYVDRYNLITFFLHHDDWRWKFEGETSLAPHIDIYRVSRGDRQILLFRDKARWLLDYQDATLYQDLKGCMLARDLPAITVFRMAQAPCPPRDAAEIGAYRKKVVGLAAAAGLCFQQLAIHDCDVNAELRAGDCSGTEAVR
jgi:hypothetical protein